MSGLGEDGDATHYAAEPASELVQSGFRQQGFFLGIRELKNELPSYAA
jgi:hypothetical protein